MKYTFKPYEPLPLQKNHLPLGDETFGVTNKYFTKNGRPWIGVMGEFHFSRYNCGEWRRELAKMKAGGVTVVSTYIFWNHHEEDAGFFDFAGNKNLRGFVEACREEGLYAFLRIGPWAHGECRNGGFPDWLYEKTPAQRQNNEPYLAYVRRFYEQIYAQVQGLFIGCGGNIIGVQIENELTDQPQHLGTLKRMAREIGFDVPLWTVTGWDGDGGAKFPTEEFVPVFGGYCEGPWFQHREELPPSVHSFFIPTRNDATIGADLQVDPVGKATGWRIPYELYPFATCELGGGIQVTHHRRPMVKPMDIYSIALVKLGCGNNLPGYYMFHGGTNPVGKFSTLQETTETGYPNDYSVLSYDFQAPLSEYGEVRGQYRLLNLLHLFVQDFGELLAPMDAVMAAQPVEREDISALRYAMRTNGTGGFVFVNHYQRLRTMPDVEDVVLDTGTVQFPPVSVRGDVSFFLPFNLELCGETLRWATAQPVCREGDTVFFAAVEGIRPQFCFADGTVLSVAPGLAPVRYGGLQLVVLAPQQALYLRRLSGKLFLGEDCDLYEENGEPCAAAPGSFAYFAWDGRGFIRREVQRPFHQAVLTVEPMEEPFTPPYLRELAMNGERARVWKKLSVSTPEGFVEITDPCDAAQIYVNGELAADNFYYGRPWRVPARLLYGKECCLVLSELKDDFYREF